MKKNNKKGFTLAELLIVVAIIAVLVLIAIPVFTASLNKSKAATDEANCRSLYAELQADYLNTNAVTTVTGIIGTDETVITYTDSTKYTLQAPGAKVTVSFAADKGYKIVYTSTVTGYLTQTWGS